MSIKITDIIWIDPPVASNQLYETWRVIYPKGAGEYQVAIVKKLYLNSIKSQEIKEYFNFEEKLSEIIHSPHPHKNIIQIYNSLIYENKFLLFLENTNGPRIKDIQSVYEKLDKNFPLPFTIFIISETLKALDYVHKLDGLESNLKIIHKNINPRNIFVSYQGNIKIKNWGLPNKAIDLFSTDFNDYSYMLPPSKIKPPGPIEDIFSCGVILWELLTNKRLFGDIKAKKDASIIGSTIAEDPRKLNSLISENLSKITLRALNLKGEAKIFLTAMDFANALDRELEIIFPNFNKKLMGLFLQDLFIENLEKERLLVKNAIDRKNASKPVKNTEPDISFEDTDSVSVSIKKIEPLLSQEVSYESGFINFITKFLSLLNEIKYFIFLLINLIKKMYASNKPNKHSSARKIESNIITLEKDIPDSKKLKTNENIPEPIRFIGTTSHIRTFTRKHNRYSSPKNFFSFLIFGSLIALGISFTINHGGLKSLLSLKKNTFETSDTTGADNVSQLEKIPAILKISSEPSGASVYIETDYICKTPCNYLKAHTNSIKNIDLIHVGYKPYYAAVRIKENIESFHAILQKNKIPSGFLTLTSLPENANIYLDGKLLKIKSPIKKIPVNPGVRFLTLTKTEGKRTLKATLTVNIKPGGHVSKAVELK